MVIAINNIYNAYIEIYQVNIVIKKKSISKYKQNTRYIEMDDYWLVMSTRKRARDIANHTWKVRCSVTQHWLIPLTVQVFRGLAQVC